MEGLDLFFAIISCTVALLGIALLAYFAGVRIYLYFFDRKELKEEKLKFYQNVNEYIDNSDFVDYRSEIISKHTKKKK